MDIENTSDLSDRSDNTSGTKSEIEQADVQHVNELNVTHTATSLQNDFELLDLDFSVDA